MRVVLLFAYKILKFIDKIYDGKCFVVEMRMFSELEINTKWQGYPLMV